MKPRCRHPKPYLSSHQNGLPTSEQLANIIEGIHAPRVTQGRNVASASQTGRCCWQKEQRSPGLHAGSLRESRRFSPKPSERYCMGTTGVILIPVCSSGPWTKLLGRFQARKEAGRAPRLSLCAQHPPAPSSGSGAILSPTLPSSAGGPATRSSSSSLARSLEAAGPLPCPG